MLLRALEKGLGDTKVNRIRVMVAFLIVAVMLTVSETYALTGGQSGEIEDVSSGLMNILPMIYWHT